MSIQPGEWFHRDCRPPRPPSPSPPPSPPLSSPSSPVPLRVVQWNIERGYELPRIIAELRSLNADVVALQEVDVGCERSGGEDVGLRIAEALQLNYSYLCEFLELHSPLRSPRTQGGKEGHHGHALLSRWEMKGFEALAHPHQAVQWEVEGEARKEPRRGRRVTMKAVVECGGGAELLVYNGHFEVFCGLTSRLHALGDILEDARHSRTNPQQLILADCNTSQQHISTPTSGVHCLWMAHGIARLSPLYCTDAMRWRSLGWTESEWWSHFVLDVGEKEGPINRRLLPFLPSTSPLLSALRNTDPPFWDPFDPYDAITLVSHGGWYQAKLDWTLVRGDIAVTRHWLSNLDYKASDHRLMALDLTVGNGLGKERGGEEERRRGRVRRRRPGICTCTTNDRIYAMQWLTVLSAVTALLSYLVSLYRYR